MPIEKIGVAKVRKRVKWYWVTKLAIIAVLFGASVALKRREKRAQERRHFAQVVRAFMQNGDFPPRSTFHLQK